MIIRNVNFRYHTLQKMKFSIKNFFSKCDQIRIFLHCVVIYTVQARSKLNAHKTPGISLERLVSMPCKIVLLPNTPNVHLPEAGYKDF